MKLDLADFRDIEDRVEKYRNRLLQKTKTALLREKQYGFRKAVNAVFSQYKGQAIPLPALIALTLKDMAVTQDSYRKMTKGLLEYLRLPSNRNWLSITSGKNGGVRRIRDIPKKRVSL